MDAPTLCLSLNTPAPGRTLAGVKRRQADVYRERAGAALERALRRWCLAHLGEQPAPGINLGPFLGGKYRYWSWTAGAGTGDAAGPWLSDVRGVCGGRSGDCGGAQQALLTAAGLTAGREAAQGEWWWPRT